MTEPSNGPGVDEGQGGDRSPDSDSLAELRALLLGPRDSALARLHERLDNPRRRAADLSEVLPDAIVLRRGRDDHLARALMPTLEEAIQVSVKRDPRRLVDALFPVMAPAIRKAVSEALRGVLESLNELLGQSFSLRSLRWRWEAFRTGKPFAEIVLFHTLVYRVGQILLVHRKTGLLLHHVERDLLPGQHADMVSGMLTAIQDFVRDSFRIREGDLLDTLRIGGVTVRIVQGPHAMIAAVVRGNPPLELQAELQRALELIHLELGGVLEAFQGDPSPFEATRPQLEACLIASYVTPPRKVGPRLVLVVGALVLALGLVWSARAVWRERRWTGYVERLRVEPGIVVTSAQQRAGTYVVTGLRDPLAADPAGLLTDAGLDPGEVVFRWEPYLALRPEFVLTRARQVLDAPPDVRLTLDGSTLVARGTAPRQWAAEARRLARTIPGVTAYRDAELVDGDLAALDAEGRRVEAARLHFVEGMTTLVPDQEAALARLVSEVARLQSNARRLGRSLQLEVMGHTDGTGSEALNRTLGDQRAATIRALLVARGGLLPAEVSAVGVGPTRPLREERTAEDRALNRRVSFRVQLAQPSAPGNRP